MHTRRIALAAALLLANNLARAAITHHGGSDEALPDKQFIQW